MFYKNITKEVLKFRGYDTNGIEKVFELKPGGKMETDRKAIYPGIEEIKEEKTKKAKKGDK